MRETKQEIRITAQKKKEKDRVKAQAKRTYLLWNIPPRNGEKNTSRPVTSATKSGEF